LKWFLYMVVTVCGIGVGYLLFWPVAMQPLAWRPAPDPGLTGPYVSNEDLASAELLNVGDANGRAGPESVAYNPSNGLLYTGLDDGTIVRIDPETHRVEPFADTGGRPLGMQFDAAGDLLVADAWKGLLRVPPDGTIHPLADCGDGKVVGYTDSLAISPSGRIWFTCPSRRWSLNEIRLDAMETQPTGRLRSYDQATGNARTELDQLMFANGVVVDPGERFVLVNEWYGYRITRLWIDGPQAGRREVFFENAPGYPDNLFIDSDGLVWVGLVIRRNATLDHLHAHPFWMKVLARVPAALQPYPPRFGWLLAIDPAGRVAHNLQDPSGRLEQITGTLKLGEWLYLTSNALPALARVAAPPLHP
jgi:sugar lactone lactonase YvrE